MSLSSPPGAELPSALELALLELIGRGGARASWHWLASHLARYDVPRVPDMMVALQRLHDQGLLARALLDAGMDRWSLTPRGQARLQQLQGLGSRATSDPLDDPELQRLLVELRSGPERAIAALIPYADDVARHVAILHRVLAADATLAERVALGGAALPPAQRGEFAKTLLADPRPSVRAAVFTVLHGKRRGVNGQAVRTLPDPAWDALLRAGLDDPDPAVRDAAVELTFASDRAALLSATAPSLHVVHEAATTTSHWVPVRDGYVTAAGAPSRAQLSAWRRRGATDVVTLQRADEMPPWLPEACAALGLYWHHLPLSGRRLATAADQRALARLPQLATLLSSAPARRLLFHCAAGLHRTAVAIYLVLRHLGLDAADATRAIGEARRITGEEFQRTTRGGPALVEFAERIFAASR